MQKEIYCTLPGNMCAPKEEQCGVICYLTNEVPQQKSIHEWQICMVNTHCPRVISSSELCNISKLQGMNVLCLDQLHVIITPEVILKVDDLGYCD